MDKIKTIEAGDLNVAYFETGKIDGNLFFFCMDSPTKYMPTRMLFHYYQPKVVGL